MLAAYREHLPLIPGAVDAVQRLAARFPLGLASSSNRELIDTVLDVAGVAALFAATVSSEEVAHGKPAPDVYLEAARRLGRRARALHRGRGLARRHPLGEERRYARRRHSEPELSAGRRGARARRRHHRLARRAYGRRRISVTPSRIGTRTHSTRSSAMTCSLKVAIPSLPARAESVLSARMTPSSASFGSTAS